jgi:ABC-type branched-subunit amino acid transport system substrate-binding protein
MAVRKAWVALAAISIVVAGCGSSSQHSSSTSAVGATSGTTASAAGNTASAPGVTATTVKIGLITSVTGASSSTFGDTAQGAQARFDVQNANGGVNGRKLDLVWAMTPPPPAVFRPLRRN